MSKIYTTEITSDKLVSDNPLHQRLLKPYSVAKTWIRGDLLEVGCGEGRGIPWLLPHINSYSAIDKISEAVIRLKNKYPAGNFKSGHLPPLPYEDGSFDSVISFQVIEHIEDDALFLKEIHRVLKPGGIALITTPNRLMSLSRNPWHIREYTGSELKSLATTIFSAVEMKGIDGNETVKNYHEKNRQSVQALMRWDILDLQHKLPASLLKIPYEIMNRINRNRLRNNADQLVTGITIEDYLITEEQDTVLDLFLIAGR